MEWGFTAAPTRCGLAGATSVEKQREKSAAAGSTHGQGFLSSLAARLHDGVGLHSCTNTVRLGRSDVRREAEREVSRGRQCARAASEVSHRVGVAELDDVASLRLEQAARAGR